MDSAEARELLEGALGNWEQMTWSELSQHVRSGPAMLEIVGQSGQSYQIEIEALWDDQAGGDIRVVGSIDDGGVRAFYPLTSDFIARRN